ncbi:MAG TPA: hypothetical protein VHH34_14395 [Pseudonocardiaceae bacterium]|nr:hypothetical protein [Pseudonocardiaceae bacterium]
MRARPAGALAGVLVVLAGGLVLAGCQPTTSTTGSGPGSTCDPNGWGPLSGCDPTDVPDPGQDTEPGGLGTAGPGTRWVVAGKGYAGPRGGLGVVSVHCVPDWAYDHDPTEPGYGVWKEVPAGTDPAIPLPWQDGEPCPPGGTIYDDGPIRPDRAPLSGGERR